MGAERFYVLESRGYRINASGTTAGNGAFLTEVLVLDRGYCHRVAWSSLTTVMPAAQRYRAGRRRGFDKPATAREWPLAKRREYAAELCARLNAEAAAA